MKYSAFKLFLLFLWLACYFPFKHKYVVSENPTAELILGVMKPTVEGEVDDRWRKCLSYLNDNGIPCLVEMEESSILAKPAFYSWLEILKKYGHSLRKINGSHFSKSTDQIVTMGLSSILPFVDSFFKPKSSAPLKLSESTESFQYQYHHLSEKGYTFIIKGNPALWSSNDVINFRDNINFLLEENINFTIRN